MGDRVIAAAPPTIIRRFAKARDMAVVNCLEKIHGFEVGRHSTYALPVGVDGASLPSLVMHGGGSNLGTYYRIDGPLIARLLAMGGCTPRKVAEHLLNPSTVQEGGGWAFHLLEAYKAAVGLQESFTHDELQTTFLLALRRLIITMPGNPSSVSKDLPPTVDTDVIPIGPLSRPHDVCPRRPACCGWHPAPRRLAPLLGHFGRGAWPGAYQAPHPFRP